MKEYYKQLNDNGKIVMLLTYDFRPAINNPLVIQITKEEYTTIKDEWEAKMAQTINQKVN